MNARPPLQGSIWAASRRCSSAIASEAGGSGGGARAPDPYLLRAIEAWDYGLVARWSGGAECDSAWSGERAPPPLPPAVCAGGARGLHADERAVYGNGEERLEMLGRHRPREEETLALVAAEVLQLETLLVGLDAFRGHVHVEALGHGDHRAHDGAVAALVAEPLHEGAVDLERVHREPLEIAERRVAGTEVIDGEPHAQVLELAQLGESGRRVLHHHALRDLELEAAGVETAQVDGVRHLRHQVRVLELLGGEVHAHDEGGIPRILDLPGASLTARLGEHPLSDGHDEPRLLGQADEGIGLQEAALLVLPADERLHLGDLAR